MTVLSHEASSRALAIGGLDPSGGAGILVDAVVFARLGYMPATAVTTVTAQNSKNFLGAWPVEPLTLLRQLEAVSEEGPFACVKVGAVGSAENAVAIAEWLCEQRPHAVVVDPVVTSSSGGSLAEGDEDAFAQLLSAATLITPNAEEAAAVSRRAVTDVESAGAAAGSLGERFGGSVVVTGVRTAPGWATDVLFAAGRTFEHPHEMLEDVGDARGTGCMFASAIAGHLGGGMPETEAVPAAQASLLGLLGNARPIGRGRWQLDFGSLLAATSE